MRFSLSVSSLILLVFSSAWAAEPGVKIGLFDVRKIIEGFDLPVRKAEVDEAGIKLTPAEREELHELTGEMRRLRDELRSKHLNEAERRKLTDERNRHGERLKAIREKARTREAGQRELTEDDIAAAVTRYGKEQGFTILFEKNYWTEGDAKNAVIFPGKVVDITPEIVRRLKAEAQREDAKKEPQKKSAPVPSAKP